MRLSALSGRNMLRIVLDTVVFVRALMSPYSYWGRLLFDYGDRYELIVSEPVVKEVLEVLHRRELAGKYREVATRDLATVIDILAGASAVILTSIPAVSRDPEDDKFLATAKAGDAGYVVSADRDLLDLGEYEGIQIVTAEAFLEVLDAGEQG
jgi:putative PIN family toxin of toxin-antitoxin system